MRHWPPTCFCTNRSLQVIWGKNTFAEMTREACARKTTPGAMGGLLLRHVVYGLALVMGLAWKTRLDGRRLLV